MSKFFECNNCGEHIPHSKIEDHVKELHFWN